MKHAFSLVTLTAAAFGFAVFLTTFQSDAPGQDPSAMGALHLSGHDNGCHLLGPILADVRGGIDVLSGLRGA